MNPYILKTLLEIIALLILYIVVLRHDQRIIVLEGKPKKKKYRGYVKTDLQVPWEGVHYNVKEPSFKSTVAKETKRIKSVKK